MRVIECDRCHKRIENADKIGYVAIDWSNVKTGDLLGTNTLDNWDFCDECMSEIEAFVKMKPAAKTPDPPVEKPKATIKRPISADNKFSALTPEKIEQIRQMAREGKTVKEICEATGVSDPTVRKYKKEVASFEETEPFTESDAKD